MPENGEIQKMNFKALFEDDSGVSPVIGVILMVAITVILAAVIGTFVLGLGQNLQNNAPQATIEVTTDQGNDQVTLTHNGGDALHSQNVKVVVSSAGNSETLDGAGTDKVLSVGGQTTIDVASDGISGGAWSGSSFSTTGSLNSFSSGDTVTVKIIHKESQQVIFETEVTA